jgi:hypothetical protein
MTHRNALLIAVAATCGIAAAQDPCMLRGISWRTDAVFTIGQTTVDEAGNPYTPTGIPDGMDIFQNPTGDGVAIYVNSELPRGTGYPYTLDNGTMLTGSRVTKYVVTRNADGTGQVLSAENAIKAIYDRSGTIVTDPAQINVGTGGINGFGRFCSGVGIRGGTYSFVEDIYFCGEEDGTNQGGTYQALDIDTGNMWAVPNLGYGAWENLTPVETGDPQTVGIVCADDTTGAPLYLYIGVKNSVGDGSFLDRNGLKVGQLYYFKANDPAITTPAQFNTQGSTMSGTWVPLQIRDVAMAGMPGFDALGYKIDSNLRGEVGAAGGFLFARPEDIHANPANGSQLVFLSTGNGGFAGGADAWGTVYLIDVDVNALTASFTIAYDGDNVANPDDGIRSPDNCTWASNGKVYINEDRAIGLFGQSSGREASLWEIDPVTFAIDRVGEMNRSVVLPLDATDPAKNDIGNWESSGVIDVTDWFDTLPGETLLFCNVQAHSLRNGSIGGDANLDEGGQLFFVSNMGIDHAIDTRNASAMSFNIRFDFTNFTAGNGYAIFLATQNANTAPNGFFFGINPTLPELLAFLAPPFIGTVDGNGDASFSFNLPGQIPLGLVFDAVAVEFDAMTGLPIQSGPAVTHNL